MGLIKLQNYQTVSDKKLIESFNSMLVAADTNFTYTLQQLSSPIPEFTGKRANSVLAVQYNGSTPFLDYVDSDSTVNLQNVWTGYFSLGNTLTLNQPTEFLLRGSAAPFAGFSIAGRSTFGSGSIKHHVTVSQSSTDGDLNELHNVNNFNVSGNAVSITANSGQVNVNRLRVGDYTFPSKSGQVGAVLKIGSSKNLEFEFSDSEIVSNVNSYTFKDSKPLMLKGSLTAPALAFNDTSNGLYASPEISFPEYVALKLYGTDIFSAVRPAALAGTPGSSPVLRINAPIVLPSFSNFSTDKAHIGSLWYDEAAKALVLVSEAGNIAIGAPTENSIINTAESKEFILNPGASIALGKGTTETPSLKIGDSGLSSASKDLKITIGNKLVAKFTENGIETSTSSNGSAKIILNDLVGINNPATPVYTFSGADRLGIYRPSVNSVGVAVKGNPVAEFKEFELDLKSKKVTNLANPTSAKDAATKEYVDSIAPEMPTGTIPVAGGFGTKYVQSALRFNNGILELNSSKTTPAISLKTSNGGSVTIRTPPVIQNISFTLPVNQVSNGILQLNPNGDTAWVNKDSLTQGFFKSDGSVSMTSGLKVNVDTDKDNLMVGSGNLGIYASSSVNPVIGIAAEGNKMLEINVRAKTLTGIGSNLNAPLIRLDSTLSSYVSASEADSYTATPTYSFAGEPNTGMGQAFVQGVSMIVSGAPRLTASSSGILAHGNRIQNVGMPLTPKDVATKEYVDSVVKNPIQMSFLVTSLPAAWSTNASIVLSIYDQALIYQNAAIPLTYEGSVDTKLITLPKDFNVNSKWQVYIEGRMLPKMPNASGIRPISYLNSRALLINSPLNIGYVIVIVFS
jgi:hypothetical protein